MIELEAAQEYVGAIDAILQDANAMVYKAEQAGLIVKCRAITSAGTPPRQYFYARCSFLVDVPSKNQERP